MTKKELIEKLSQLPDNTEIEISTSFGVFDIDKIEYKSEYEKALIFTDD